MANVKEFLGRASSRKFLLSVAIITITVLNSKYNWGISTGELGILAGIIAAFIGVEGIKDIKEIK